MARKKKTMELRFYEVPQGDLALALLGENWNRVYGHDEVRLHFHNLMEIGVCRKGCGTLVLDEHECKYESGMISVIPENLPHTTISDGEAPNAWEYLFFDPKGIVEELYPDNMAYQHQIIEEFGKQAYLMKFEENESIYRIVSGIMDELRNKTNYYQQMVHQYVCLLVYELIRLNERIPYYEQTKEALTGKMQITAALEYIRKNYAMQLKIRDLADVCQMSETHFRRVFEENMNMAPMDYLNFIRIQKACELMRKSKDSMDIIALKCGFTTTSTFNRNFKKFLDTSPYQWKINPDTYERKILNYHITALKGW